MRVDINSIRNEIGNNTLDAKVIYDTYEKVGIKYGESHQGIEEMYLGDNCALVKLKLPSCVRSNKEQFVLHPSILDSAMQAYVGIEISKDGNQAIALPYAVETVDIYNKCNDDGWALVEVQEQGNLKKMRITIVNQMGQIGAILDGVTFKQIGKGQNGTSTKEKVKTQNTEIKQDETKEKTLILTPQWEISHVDNNEITPSVDENLLVICNEQVDITHIQEKYSHISKILVQPNESEESIRRKLEEVGQIKHILWALKTPEISAVSDERIIDEQEVGIIYLFRMIKALIELGYGVKHLSWTILTEKSEGVLHNDIVNPVHASIHGFIGSLAKEYPIWKMRIVDIEDVNNWDVNKIFSLPFNIDGDGIAIRKGVTYTSQLVPTKLTRQNIQSKYKKDGVYVVIGGAGGIGVEWSQYMIQNYNAKIVWIGRRQLTEEIQSNIDKVAKYGQAPMYISADATDQNQLKNAYNKIIDKWGHVNGIVHSAIVLLDKSLANMIEENFRLGLKTKVNLSVRLSQVFNMQELDFMMYFSSIQSFMKAPGQSNYAAGCVFEDHYAMRMNSENTTLAKVINWSYWGNTGVVSSQEYHERMNKMGMASIETEEAMNVLENLLAGSFNQLTMLKLL